METSNFGKGGVIDTIDSRDFIFDDTARSQPPFDWGVGFNIEDKVGIIPSKNQNGSFSCGGQAWSYYMAVLEALVTGSFEERSAKYIYSQTFVSPDGGSRGRDNCNLCIKQGVSVESLCSSYENGQPPSESFMTQQDISDTAKQNAHLSQSLSYTNVDPDIDLFAQAIRDNGGIVMGLYGKDNGTWLSLFPKPPTSLQGVWGHWLYAGRAKMIDGKKYIGIKNSWGNNVGDKGWQWIGEDYFNGYVWQSWTMLLKKPGQYIFTRDMKFGDHSEDVRQLQIRLGLDTSLQTGFYGSLTRKAVLDYQIKHITLSWYERYVLAGSSCSTKTRAALNVIL